MIYKEWIWKYRLQRYNQFVLTSMCQAILQKTSFIPDQ